jgi:hypothetical protein
MIAEPLDPPHFDAGGYQVCFSTWNSNRDGLECRRQQVNRFDNICGICLSVMCHKIEVPLGINNIDDDQVIQWYDVKMDNTNRPNSKPMPIIQRGRRSWKWQIWI